MQLAAVAQGEASVAGGRGQSGCSIATEPAAKRPAGFLISGCADLRVLAMPELLLLPGYCCCEHRLAIGGGHDGSAMLHQALVRLPLRPGGSDRALRIRPARSSWRISSACWSPSTRVKADFASRLAGPLSGSRPEHRPATGPKSERQPRMSLAGQSSGTRPGRQGREREGRCRRDPGGR